MSPERLDEVVFLSKNLDQDEALNAELSAIYGEKQWEMSKHTTGSLPEGAQSEVELSGPEFEGGINWSVMDALVDMKEEI